MNDKEQFNDSIITLNSISDNQLTESDQAKKYTWLGFNFYDLEDYENAIKNFKKIKLTWDPKYFAGAQYMLGTLTEDLKEKENFYLKVKKTHFSPAYKAAQNSIFRDLILIYFKKNNFNKAQLLLKTIDIDSLQYKKNILNRILNQSTNNDKKDFFNIFEIVENITKNLRIDILNNKYCKQFAHYTSYYVTYLTLGITSNTSELQNASKLRMGIIDTMNDPAEGQVLNNWLNIPNNLLNDRFNSRNFQSFASCFSFNHDSLNQFRLYGKTNNAETSGVSLVFNSDFFSKKDNNSHINITYPKKENVLVNINNDDKNINEVKYPLYRCIYYDPLSNYFRLAKRSDITFLRQGRLKSEDIKNTKIRLKNYKKEIEEKETAITEYIKDLSNVIANVVSTLNSETKSLLNDLLLPLRYLVKHAAFEEEEECRMIYIAALYDENIKQENGRIFVEYPPIVADYVDKIYLGEGAKKERPFLELALQKAQKGQEKIAEVRDSDNPFRVFETQ